MFIFNKNFPLSTKIFNIQNFPHSTKLLIFKNFPHSKVSHIQTIFHIQKPHIQKPHIQKLLIFKNLFAFTKIFHIQQKLSTLKIFHIQNFFPHSTKSSTFQKSSKPNAASQQAVAHPKPTNKSPFEVHKFILAKI